MKKTYYLCSLKRMSGKGNTLKFQPITKEDKKENHIIIPYPARAFPRKGKLSSSIRFGFF